jgi:hypothetical protein
VKHPLAPVIQAFAARSVRYLLIGVSGANLYAPSGQAVFATEDFDLFVPLDPENLVRAWEACDAAGLDLWLAGEPLDSPRDRWLAQRVVERRALTRATGPDSLLVDLTLVMKGFDFESAWTERRHFVIEGGTLPVARLVHIVTSKHATGRDKDRLFLATHRDALEQLLKHHET